MVYLNWVHSYKNKGLVNDYYNKSAEYKDRYKLHEAVQKELDLIGSPVHYCEFGVANGDMIKFWASKNKHPKSTFVGFDSFEGLPEDWEAKKAGHFDTEGNLPEIDDPRVTFVKGLFQDTVYNTLKERNFDHQRKIFHLDADLFSSTLYVLFQLHAFLEQGDILIFDEFSSYDHEFSAFEIFKKCAGREWKYEFVGAVNNFRQVAIQIA